MSSCLNLLIYAFQSGQKHDIGQITANIGESTNGNRMRCTEHSVLEHGISEAQPSEAMWLR